MKTVLMIAFHYPPCFGSSGILRTLKFSRYLPEHGWYPVVLTAHPRAYEDTRADQVNESSPPGVTVHRAFALDSRRHLALGGRGLRVTALPDRWVSWTLGAVPAGLRLIRRYRPSAIWSTYPIATAHLIAMILRRWSGLPWMADFRDSMTEANYPRDRLVRRAFQRIERGTVNRAGALIFTAPSSRSMYLSRYPGLAADRCGVIPNGYDEDDFAQLEVTVKRSAHNERTLRLLHAGVLYPQERDPRPLFRALSRLKRAGRVDARSLSVELRASGSEAEHARQLAELGIDDMVHLLPALSYAEVLREGGAVDALLLLQGPSCNHQIPAKLYEYLRLRKPILALTDARGDTAAVLGTTGGATILDLMSEEAIYQQLPGFLESLRLGTHPVADPKETARHARHVQAGLLGEWLERLVDGGGLGGRAGIGAGPRAGR